MNCKICSRPTTPFDTAVVLARYTVDYYQCPHCGFIQTQEPHWLEEAYANPINASDIGLASRNVNLALVAQTVIAPFFSRDGRFLDYGGGYGLFVRLMRDAGLDFYCYDKHCPNMFARGFEVEAPQAHAYELVTAFEVFEHLVQPLEEIGRILQYSRNILFSTSLVPTRTPKLTDWWYFGLDHGQHVAIYSLASLKEIARHFDLNLLSDGRRLHLLTDKRLPRLAFKLASSPAVAYLGSRLVRKPSLLPQDYYQITGQRLA
jgi:hypothetical protein